ncbi:uncharacterized protein [Sinocyclocheilus grahami]|uniref:uncharacterized protein n=1 Tax=Sinocyclocheilus grahami TaxID=75366 RepID=UPI0007ACBA87|nr:PREDICTED: uncharacterized protein LOC107552412 [Sinocyclocheilus grahami]
MDTRQQQGSDNLISPDNNEQHAVAVFDRVFNALQRARRELMATTSSNGTDGTNILTATRTLFRRRRNQAQGTSTGRGHSSWQVGLFLLPGPDLQKLPSLSDRHALTNNGLGVPAKEVADCQLSTIDLNWSLTDLNNFVCQSFPMISLNLVGFELAKVDKGKKIKKVQASSVRDLKKIVGKSRLYVVPRAEVGQGSLWGTP